MKNKYKIIVIGSGPGGSISSFRLAQAGHEVLLLEEGGSYKVSDRYDTQEMTEKYKNSGTTMTLGRPLINYAEGNCVGGGSEINSGLYHRIPEEILSKWENKNNLSFDREELYKSFKDIEDNLNISYMPDSLIPRASSIISEGCEKLGWACSEIPRWYSYDDDGNGTKQSMTETYIPKFINFGGTLKTHTKVFKIEKNKKSNIIHFFDQDKKIQKYFCDYLFVACGAINTPFLLQKSGFKSRFIGKGLKLHPSFKFTALFDEKVNFNKMGVPVHQVKEFSPEISIGCSISSKQYLANALNDTNNIEFLKEWENLATYYCMISPEGSGNVRSLKYFKSPFVTFNFTKKDITNLERGINNLGKLLFKSGAKTLFPSIQEPISFKSHEDIKKYNFKKLNKLNLMTIHLFSSVQMGGARSSFALNPEGHLWEDDSIHISDGSILSDSPSVNPQGTIMALADMNARKFLSRI